MEALISEEELQRIRRRWGVSQEWLEDNIVYPRLYTRWSDIFPHESRTMIDKLVRQMIEERHYTIG